MRQRAGMAALVSLPLCLALFGLWLPAPALAQTLSLDLGQGGGVTERALQLIAVITVLSLAPSILIMVTSFTRIAGQIQPQEAFNRGIVPFRDFMLKHVREKDLTLFLEMSREPRPERAEDIQIQVLVPAFMISELRRAFEIGFLLFVPFLIIDLVVASVLMSVGMMMLPPVTVALPFKLIFFVLVDGWGLVAGSLVKSYGS
jgi:flagellar biosynthetic protein FliP